MKTINEYAGFRAHTQTKKERRNVLTSRRFALPAGCVRNAEVGSSSLLPSTILRSPSASFGWQAKRVARMRRMSTEAAERRRWTAPTSFSYLP